MSAALLINARVEAPHVVYPKGPARRIRSFRNVQDAVAGDVVLVELDCGHQATLVGQSLTTEAIVRCPVCRYEATSSGETVIE